MSPADPRRSSSSAHFVRRRMLLAPLTALLLSASACSAAPADPDATAALQAPGDPAWTGLSSPVGMAYDSSGTLYIANWSGGSVERFMSDGTREVFADGLSGPSGLAISDDDVLYVASYSSNVVWRFDEDGEPEVFVDGLSTPAGLSFNSQGELLIANRVTNEILASDSAGRTRVAASGLQTPVGAVELDNGDLMVSNINGGISLVRAGTTVATHINTELASPAPGIAPAGGDAVYVADYGGSTIDQIARDGTRTTIADGFASPTSITVAPDGRLTIADWGTNSLYFLEPTH